MVHSRSSGNSKKFKAKKARHYQAVQFHSDKRIQKGEQKVHLGVDKLSTTFGDHRPYQRLASEWNASERTTERLKAY